MTVIGPRLAVVGWFIDQIINYDEVVSTSMCTKISGNFLKWSVWSSFLNKQFLTLIVDNLYMSDVQGLYLSVPARYTNLFSLCLGGTFVVMI